MDIISELKWRGVLKSTTNPYIANQLANPICVFAGFDPTADSLHIGNLVALLTLRRFQLAGHKVVALIGGATGMIGDPSGRTDERSMLSAEVLQSNIEGIRSDIEKVLDFRGENPAQLVNNADWVSPIGIVTFLRDIGKHFRVNTMLQQSSVKDRLEREDGISFTEFTYSLIQAFDFQHLFDKFGCILQIGGSDQWGNITSGIELIRKTRNVETFGLTLELLLDSTGKKFGKSVSGDAMFLSATKTSAFKLLQHLLNTRDEDVERFLKTFSLLTTPEIERILEIHNQDLSKRIGQNVLANELTMLIHGKTGLDLAHKATDLMLGKTSLDVVGTDVIDTLFRELPGSQVVSNGTSVVEGLVNSKLCDSKSAAVRAILNNGVSINRVKVTDPKTLLPDSCHCLLGVGKKQLVVMKTEIK